jgi:hypothetical protein
MPVKKNQYPEFGDDPEEIPYATRIEMAFDAWTEANGDLSIRRAAKKHGVV